MPPRNRFIRFTPLGLALVLVLYPGLAMAQTSEARFIERKAEGWFFYNEQIEEEVPPIEELPPEPPQTVTETTPPPVADAQPAPEPSPAPLSAEWMRENLPKYMDRAWDDPSPENVQAFFMLQRYAMDRSGEFAEVAQRVTMGNPMLDESTRRPFSTFAAQDLDRIAGQQRNALIDKISQSAGLFVFYSSDCRLCQTMAPVLAHLDGQFEMTPISMDGQDLPGNPFPRMRPNQGHAEQLGVQSLPAIFLVSEDAEFIPLAQGATSLTDLRERIVLGAVQIGVISEDEFNRTRTVNNLHINLANQPLNLEDAPVDPNGLIDPRHLIQTLQTSPASLPMERQ